jgi:NAD(P)H-nitrite reductase large subunit
MTEKIEFIYKNNNITHYKLNGRVFEVDYVVQCTGVRPNNYLGESSALVLGSYGGLKVDNKLKTSDSNIFAARR